MLSTYPFIMVFSQKPYDRFPLSPSKAFASLQGRTALTTDLERPAASRLPLLSSTLLGFRPRAAQHLQEIGGASAHAAVDVGFAGFDVVVEVVAEGLDVRDDLFAARWGEVAGEEDCEREGRLCVSEMLQL
jgi:hypothetical protein